MPTPTQLREIRIKGLDASQKRPAACYVHPFGVKACPYNAAALPANCTTEQKSVATLPQSLTTSLLQNYWTSCTQRQCLKRDWLQKLYHHQSTRSARRANASSNKVNKLIPLAKIKMTFEG